MKDVLVDLYKIKELYSGLGQFSLNFANTLLKESAVNLNFIFLTPGNFKLEGSRKYDNINANFQKRYLPMFNKPYDIWHSLHQFPAHFPNRKSIFILTIHDLNFLIEKNESKKVRYLNRLQQNVDKADCLTTISGYTKKTIEENLNLRGKDVHIIYNGVALETLCEVEKPVFVTNDKFFFSIGIISQKKNFHVLLGMMKYFKDYHLIIAGKKDTVYGKYIQNQIDEMNLNSRVIMPGKISESEKQWLYNNCEALLFPSLAEGFGLPVIEAMNFGKPVFLSKYTSLPEIGGDLAYYFEDFREEHMSSFIKSKLQHFAENQTILSASIKKYASGFSWQLCISQYLKLYHDLAGKTPNGL